MNTLVTKEFLFAFSVWLFKRFTIQNRLLHITLKLWFPHS